MDASFVKTSKRLQRLCNFTRESITKIPNQSYLYMFFFFVKVAKASERKCPKNSKAPPEPQLYALVNVSVCRFVCLLYGLRIVYVFANTLFCQQLSVVNQNVWKPGFLRFLCFWTPAYFVSFSVQTR